VAVGAPQPLGTLLNRPHRKRPGRLAGGDFAPFAARAFSLECPGTSAGGRPVSWRLFEAMRGCFHELSRAIPGGAGAGGD
jgi:hypothetical protein